MKTLIEKKGKLLTEYGAAVNAKNFDQAKVDKLFDDLRRVDAEIKLKDQENQDLSKSLDTGKGPVHEIRDGSTGKLVVQGRDGDLEQYVSDMVRDAFGHEVSNRDILGGSGSGAYIVPEHLKGPMISYIIEKSVLGRLGVQNVAVQTDVTKYAEVTVLPTANTIAEGGELTETDPTFEPRELKMFSYRAGTIITQEFAEDSLEHPKNIFEPLAQSIANNIDNDFINGAGTNEPMGLDNMTGVYMRLHLGVNGAALTGYEELGALWQKARDLNHSISAFVMAPRTLKEYRLLEDAHEAPKDNPFGEIPMVETVHVGVADTQGTSSIATKIFAGDFKNNVWAGWRYGSADSLKFLVDRSTLAEHGKIRIYAYTRCGLAYPRGYGVFGYVKGVTSPAGSIT